ncbi:hypothetical protein [Pontibacter sp. HSC-36F09]|uniref:hypothetical protein n=1 Tax=Pontibacter sp. HSC-36F09 TaxID=2910966 RepID=UPI0020A201FF|nr:hypothetical protein [Pontibacter sp. HSC-36F09]MCP2044199.1 hypothetical protein [Pontibacter sp. HSC-36F09]
MPIPDTNAPVLQGTVSSTNVWLAKVAANRQFVGCYTFGFLFADALAIAQAF